MAAILAFLITLCELVIVVGSAAVHSHNVLYNALVYGSPFYLVMNILNSESALWDKNPVYLMLLCFHIFKYFLIFRAQLSEEFRVLRWGVIIMEAAYLGVSAYYNN